MPHADRRTPCRSALTLGIATSSLLMCIGGSAYAESNLPACTHWAGPTTDAPAGGPLGVDADATENPGTGSLSNPYLISDF